MQAAIFVALLALVSNAVAAPAPAIPAALAPIVAAATSPLGVAAGVVSTGAVVAHGASTANRQKHSKMEFASPIEGTVFKCGEAANINVVTYGFGSFWGISRAKFHLLDKEGNKVADVMNRKLSDFLKEERTMGIGRPRNGKGSHSWTIPETVVSGKYKLEFESHDAFNTDYSRLRFLSPTFTIECSAADQAQAQTQASQTSETAAQSTAPAAAPAPAVEAPKN